MELGQLRSKKAERLTSRLAESGLAVSKLTVSKLTVLKLLVAGPFGVGMLISLGLGGLVACSDDGSVRINRIGLKHLDVREGVVGAGNGRNSGDAQGGVGGAALSAIDAFQKTVHPLVKEQCASCHATEAPAAIAPFFASADPVVAHDALITTQKVNFAAIDKSRLVLRLGADNHNCWTECSADAATMRAAIADWQAALPKEGDEAAQLPVTASLGLGAITKVEAPVQNPPGVVALEAETATLTAPMITIAQDGSSGGTVTGTPAGAGTNINTASAAADNSLGRSTFTVEIETAGTYRVYGRIGAPSANNNSFYLRMDDGALQPWRFAATGGQLQWDSADGVDAVGAPYEFDLDVGTHTLEVRQREEQSVLDMLVLASDPGFDPINAVVSGGEVDVLTFDLSTLTGIPEAALTIEIEDYSETAYKFKNPRIVSTAPIEVKDLKILINGSYLPQHSVYTVIDKVATAEDGLLSPFALVALKDLGSDDDQFSVRFEVLTAE